MPNDKFRLILSLCASGLLLTGCVGAAVGAGAALGVSAAKEGGLQTSVKDEAIRIKISDLWFKRSTDMFAKLNLNVNQGRVLVTGVVQHPEDRVEAIRLAWQPKGVKQVINEIRVGKSGTVGSFAQDTWIAGQLRTRLTFEKYIQSINYSIEVVQGTVYLMGVAQDQPELDRTIGVARRIKGVKEVISYVKLAGYDADIGPTHAEGKADAKKVNGSTPPVLNSTTDPVGRPASGGAVTEKLDQKANPLPSRSNLSGIQSEVLPP
jgi:osmotically-inducible protein OsmY